MNQLIVTPRTSAELRFLKKLLQHIGNVEEVKAPQRRKRKTKTLPFASLSESSLAKEWLSSEDNVWDEWYGKRIKRHE